MIDGREGITCPDCGATLQAVRLDGEDVLRCPWAKPEMWSRYDYVANTQIYCNRPLDKQRLTATLRVD